MKKYGFISVLILLAIQVFACGGAGKGYIVSAEKSGYRKTSRLPVDLVDGHTIQFHHSSHSNNRLPGFDGCYSTAAVVDPAKENLCATFDACSGIHAKRYLNFIYPSHNFW